MNFSDVQISASQIAGGNKEPGNPKAILYIAVSLDGFIAGPNGSVAFLDQVNSDHENISDSCGYEAFIQTVDIVIMGYTTYYQVMTELSPDQWPYSDLDSYVLTRRNISDKERIFFRNMPAAELVRQLKCQSSKNIWICGGAQVAGQLMEAGAIDEYHLTIIPILLGQGIRLFPDLKPPIPLKLVSSFEINGTIDCIYRPI